MSDIESLLDLHTAFWERRLTQPIINTDCSFQRRFRSIPLLPPALADKEGLLLEPDMLSPAQMQPPPLELGREDNRRGQVAFNAWMPHIRIPWLPGIMGCGLKVSASSQTIWPLSYAPARWYELENQGFAPNTAWLDKLLEFLAYIRDQWYPDRCLPAQDVIVRGPGDLLLHVLEAENLYLGMYDHPQPVRRLLDQITALYIRWAQAQLEIIPQTEGGYVNPYGTWCPGTCVRTQEDYAKNLSPAHLEEFLMPAARRVVAAFDFSVFHTHSAVPHLVEALLELDDLNGLDVALDPNGPTIEESIPLWNRVLEKKCLYILGPVTRSELELMVSNLSPGGLWFDIEIMPDDIGFEHKWEWSHPQNTSHRA